MHKTSIWKSLCGLTFIVAFSAAAMAQSSPSLPLPAFYSDMPFIGHSRHLDTTGAWISQESQAIKCNVSKDGVHKISFEWLENAGISPSGIIPSRLRLVRDGKTLPLSFHGLEDGSFDAGDAVFFIGTRNYGDPDYYRTVTPDTPHPQYLNKYSDSSAYWLFFDATPSSQFPARNVAGVPAGTVNSHLRITHYEPEISLQFMGTNVDRLNLADWTREDTWIMQFIQPDQTKTLQFEVRHLVPGRNPVFRVAAAGYQGPSAAALNHKLLLRLKDGPFIDSASFGSTDQVILQGSVPGSSLADGTHILEVESQNIQQSFTRCVIDNYEIEYEQQLVAENNHLTFGPLATAPGVMQVEISGISDTNCIVLSTGISSSYRIYPKYKSDGTSFKAVFADSVSEHNRYYLSSIPGALEPSSGSVVDLANLRTNIPDVDWLAITSREFLASVQEYAQFVAQEYSVTTAVVTVEDIYDSYSFGVFNPEAIKLYLYDFFRNRAVTENLPFVALIGDANYNFKEKSPKYGENYVPGYGFPVSDMLYVCFDSAGLQQQANIGRIPVRSGADLIAYQSRHEAYRGMPLSDWNKSVILVSGGDAGENDAQLAFYRNINEKIAENSVLPAPFGGKRTHIYKTASPPSSFGPYSEAEVRSVFEQGGIAISYVGHSATATWDNGIDDPVFLMDMHNIRPPLVTDFGCSSGKFAEPNAMSFAEKYVSAADAPGIAYIGNASFGYRSTAQLFPGEFYHILLKQGVRTTGEAHLLAKRAMIQRFGSTISFRNAVQMSTLLGDPILQLAIPSKPDASVSAEDIVSIPSILTDDVDSLRFEITVHNFGLVPPSILQVKAEYAFKGVNQGLQLQEVPFPYMTSTVSFAFPPPGSTGGGSVRIILDPANQHDELDEANNHATYEFSILNSTVKIINRMRTSSGMDTLTVLNPYLDPGEVSGITLECSSTADFSNPTITEYDYGFIASYIAPLTSIPNGEKRYIRLKLNGVNSSYTDTYSIWNKESLPFYQQDSADWSVNQFSNLLLSHAGLQALPSERILRVVSSGPFDGGLADVLLNGTTVFSPLAVQGYFVAVFERDSMNVKETRAFATAVSSAEADSLAAFLQSRTGDELLVIASSADPTANRDRFSEAFREIGAKFIDSVITQGSYACITTPHGGANERYSGPMTGPVSIDTALSAPRPDGIVRSGNIGPAGKWSSVRMNATGDIQGSRIRVIGVTRKNNEVFLLETGLAASIDISHIDVHNYPYIILELTVSGKASRGPWVHSWGVDYLSAPELAMNYQSVYTESDTIYEGERLWTRITFMNAGETASLPSYRCVEQLHNSKQEYSSSYSMDPIGPGLTWKADYQAMESLSAGTGSVIVSLDTGNVNVEQVSANNAFRVEYHIIADSSKPVLYYTFDHVIPFNGDYIAATPRIELTLQPGNTAIRHAGAFQLWIDGNTIDPWSGDAAFTPSSDGQSAVWSYTAELSTGEHEFRINAITPSGIMAYDEDLMLNLIVESGPRIKNMYPVPNPFAESTRFTFILGGAEQPDHAEIQVYTIAGRLINKITIQGVHLRIGQNVVPWDGKDADGDALANGTYFYRLKVVSGTETASMLGKMTILR